jgi:hypothetical protein
MSLSKANISHHILDVSQYNLVTISLPLVLSNWYCGSAAKAAGAKRAKIPKNFKADLILNARRDALTIINELEPLWLELTSKYLSDFFCNFLTSGLLI